MERQCVVGIESFIRCFELYEGKKQENAAAQWIVNIKRIELQKK